MVGFFPVSHAVEVTNRALAAADSSLCSPETKITKSRFTITPLYHFNVCDSAQNGYFCHVQNEFNSESSPLNLRHVQCDMNW
jgi:hypothetical protein